LYLQAAALERLKASIEGARMSLSTQVGDGGQADATIGNSLVEPLFAVIPIPSSMKLQQVTVKRREKYRYLNEKLQGPMEPLQSVGGECIHLPAP
jgi:hypothetical protein